MIDTNYIILIILMSVSYTILNYLYLNLSVKKKFLKTSMNIIYMSKFVIMVV